MSSLYHAKLGGGYTQRREIIIDAAHALNPRRNHARQQI